MKQHRRMPVGVDDFRKLRQQYYFVDKTRFIQELIDGHSEVTLITRPRRFGKTLTLSMLYYFFTDENAEENRALFDGCRIAGAGEEYMEEQGKYPVIFFSLKDVKVATWESCLTMLRNLLAELYDGFPSLRSSPALSEREQTLYRDILFGKASSESYMESLRLLTVFLEKHYGKKPILLLDEYDAPIQAAWEHDYYDQAIGFFRNFLSSAFKTNPSLEFAVLTGVLRIAKESIFSALNNLDVSSVVSGHYADVMGFTPEEVRRMAEDLGHADKLDEIRDWYDGYDFSGHEIYNPWSVINYFDRECEAEPYWVNTSGNAILADMLSEVDSQRESELLELLEGKTVSTALRDTAIYHEIYKSRDALYTMLMTTGYLKCVRRHKVQDEEWADLAIPNREVRLVFRREIMEHLASGLGTSTLRLMLDAMKAGNAPAFESHLQRILRENVSIHDTAYPETFYHGMMLGFSVLLADRYEIESNRESGYGRFDLAFIPKDREPAGIIMEFKKAAGEDALEAAARAALEQIGDKEYVTTLTKRGIDKIWKYGIAFAGKRLKLVCG